MAIGVEIAAVVSDRAPQVEVETPHVATRLLAWTPPPAPAPAPAPVPVVHPVVAPKIAVVTSTHVIIEDTSYCETKKGKADPFCGMPK
jgi:hypothetical protein